MRATGLGSKSAERGGVLPTRGRARPGSACAGVSPAGDRSPGPSSCSGAPAQRGAPTGWNENAGAQAQPPPPRPGPCPEVPLLLMEARGCAGAHALWAVEAHAAARPAKALREAQVAGVYLAGRPRASCARGARLVVHPSRPPQLHVCSAWGGAMPSSLLRRALRSARSPRRLCDCTAWLAVRPLRAAGC